MKNIHILPTVNYSPLAHSTNKYGDYFFLSRYYSPMKEMGDSYQNIYITSDEEIKEGDYGVIGEVIMNYSQMHKMWNMPQGKKIILTTDQDLIADGVQKIDDEFLQWFVKNPSCEYVKTDLVPVNEFGSEITVGSYGFDKFKYKIIIPQEESKQDLEKEMFDLEQELDIPSSFRWHNSKPNQETLEEVECNNCGYLMSLTEDESVYACYNSECTSCYEEYEEVPNLTDEKGRPMTYWGGLAETNQDKRMYSEEDLKDAYFSAIKATGEGWNGEYAEGNSPNIEEKFMEDFNKWFEQFKKK